MSAHCAAVSSPVRAARSAPTRATLNAAIDTSAATAIITARNLISMTASTTQACPVWRAGVPGGQLGAEHFGVALSSQVPPTASHRVWLVMVS